MRRLSGGPSLRLRHPGDALSLRLLLLRRSALKPPLLRSVLRPRRNRPIPRGGFSGVEVCPLFVVLWDSGAWRPIIDLSTLNMFIASQRFHMDRFPMGGVSYQLRVLCFGLTTAPHVFTRLMAPISTILHRYVVGMLRYLDDWLILAESRTTGIQARDRLLQVCEELGLQVNCRKSSLIPSQDMTYLDMQIQSVQFITRPTETWVGNLLRIIKEFLSSLGPPPQQLSGVVLWTTFRPLLCW